MANKRGCAREIGDCCESKKENILKVIKKERERKLRIRNPLVNIINNLRPWWASWGSSSWTWTSCHGRTPG